MINELDEKLKVYSDEYFINEFVKSKPIVGYCKLERRCGVAIGAFFVLLPVLILSIMCWSRLYYCLYWLSLCLFLCLLVDVFLLVKLERQRTKILLEMANAYLEKHGEIKGRIPNGSLKTSIAQNKYIHSIENAYRAEIVRQYLSNDYSISVIKALNDEVEIKEVKFGLGFFSVCSLLALSVSLVAWGGFDIKSGWHIAFVVFFYLVAIPVVIYVFKIGRLELFTNKRRKELRETLSFMLYDQCKE